MPDILVVPPASPLLLPERAVSQPEKRRKLAWNLSSPRLCPSSPVMNLMIDPTPSEDEWWTLEQDPGEAVRLAVLELQKYVQEYKTNLRDPFWQRKSGKVVLAVVVFGKKGALCSELTSFRGMNTEVSLPSGSLCAERGALNAAASCFSHSTELQVVACADPEEKIVPLWPCEVCQSWLSKLKVQSPEMLIVSCRTLTSPEFAIFSFAEWGLRPPPRPVVPSSPSDCSPWRDKVQLAEGTEEWPWQACDVVYIDGVWSYLHPGHQNILREAKKRGSHVLVGIHSDEVMGRANCPQPLEDYDLRCSRLLSNRHVSSVLKDAPWVMTHEMIEALCITKVVAGTISKWEDCGRSKGEQAEDPYAAPKELGIFEEVDSRDETTERSHHEKAHNRASRL